MKQFLCDRQNVALSGVFVLTTVALIFLTNGSIGAALVPIVSVLVLLLFICLPLRITVTLFFTVVLLFHNPAAYYPYKIWNAPLAFFGKILFTNLRHLTGIGALRFNLIEVGLALILVLIAIRTLMGNNIDRHQDMPAARSMKIAAFVSLLAVFLFIAWGLIRGNADTSEMLWQIRTRFWVPFLLIICMRAFKTEQDIRRLAVALAVVCVVRITEGMFLNFIIVIPQGLDVKCLMTHGDTVWFTTILVALISSFLERMDRRALVRLLTLGVFVMYGIFINDRRIAYVSLMLSIAAMGFLARLKLRRWIFRIILAGIPILILYFVIGMNSQAAIFAPVHTLVSVTDTNDSSNWCRNVENHDLIQTLKTNFLLGTGWGHGYNDILTEVEFTNFAYRFHPHNSMLGLLTYSGAIGFYLTWIFLPVGVFLARRVYLTASTPLQRTTATTAICTVIIYMIQSYGDMGAKDFKTAIVLCAALGIVANLSQRIGALDEKPNVSP